MIVTARADEDEEAVCSLAFLLLRLTEAVSVWLSALREAWSQANLILLLEPLLATAATDVEVEEDVGEGRRCRLAAEAAAGLLIGSLISSGLVSTVTGFCSELVVELVAELRRPNSGLRIFSTEKGKTRETC